ncbi:hypothetical protein D9M68_873650 [compost metagenome]
MNVYLFCSLLQVQYILQRKNLFQLIQVVIDLHVLLVYFQLCFFINIAEIDFHKETIQLCRRQRISTLRLYRVLRSNRKERLLQLYRLFPYCDLPFGHTFQ